MLIASPMYRKGFEANDFPCWALLIFSRINSPNVSGSVSSVDCPSSLILTSLPPPVCNCEIYRSSIQFKLMAATAMNPLNTYTAFILKGNSIDEKQNVRLLQRFFIIGASWIQ